MGVRMSDPISQQITRQIGVPGVLVLGVEPDSPADRAGLRGTRQHRDGAIEPGDVIVEVDGKKVLLADEIFAILERKKAGDTITMTIWREGEQSKIDVTLEEATQ